MKPEQIIRESIAVTDLQIARLQDLRDTYHKQLAKMEGAKASSTRKGVLQFKTNSQMVIAKRISRIGKNKQYAK